MRRFVEVGLLACVALAPISPQAKAPPPSFVLLKGGAYFPAAADVSGFGSGLTGELSLGRSFDRGFAMEASFGSFTTSGTVDAAAGRAARRLRISPLSVSLRGTAPVGGFEPYACAGVGVYFVRDELGSPVLGSSGATSAEAANLGFHAGVGGTLLLSGGLFVGLEGKYHLLRANTFGGRTRLDGTVLTAGVGYRF